MNVLIIGCGKVGSNLCNELSKLGYDVSVISKNEEDFSELSPDFNGFTTVGVAIDQDVLRRAGIESCDAVAAVTSDDNVNLMVIQLAKELFHINNVFARVVDPKKNEVFAKMGLNTICPTNMTVSAMAAAISGSRVSEHISVGDHSMIVTKIDVDKSMVGHRLSELSLEEMENIIAIEHEDNSVRPVFLTNYELMRGDKLICARFVD